MFSLGGFQSELRIPSICALRLTFALRGFESELSIQESVLRLMC